MTKHFQGLAFGAAIAVGLGMGASGALADGYYVGSVKDTAPIPAPVAYEWNGLSVGAGIGVGWFDQDAYGEAWRNDSKSRETCEKKINNNFYDCGSKKNYGENAYLDSLASDDDGSWFGTVQIGYDRLLGDRLLIGAFADFDFHQNNELKLSDSSYKGYLSGSVEKDHMWTVGGRLGFLVTPRVLLYGLVGYSQMNLEGNLDAYFEDPYDNGKPSDLSVKVKDSVGGWTVGGGVEAKLERRLSLKLEYRYSSFDGVSKSKTGGGSDSWYKSFSDGRFDTDYHVYNREYTDGAKLDLGDTDVHSVRAVLSFKLGRDEEQTAPLK